MTWRYKEYYRRNNELWDIIASTQAGEKEKVAEYYDTYCRIARNRGALPDSLPAWIGNLKRVYASRI